MFIDARSLPPGETVDTDVCIVGSGPAGITLAREFAGRPFRTCLVESGGLDFDDKTQSLYKGKNIGLNYYPLEGARLRYFGGTSGAWAGRCRPLEPFDFETREWVPYSGWPLKRSDLDPFYARSQSVCQLGPYEYEPEYWETEKRRRLPFKSDRIRTKIFQYSPPTRFGTVYREQLSSAPNVKTLLNGNLVELETTSNAQTVTRARIACLNGKQFWIKAKRFVLACGGIETARILLLSNKIQKAGLGNQYDLVGRFFMDHACPKTGLVFPSRSDISFALYDLVQREHHMVASLTLSPETMREEKLLHACITLYGTDIASQSKGSRALRYLLNHLRKGEVPDEFWRNFRDVITDIEDVAVAGYRKLSGQREDEPVQAYGIEMMIEQQPNPESRVTLSTDRDELGQNRPQLNFQFSDSEKHTLRRTQEILGQELGRAGLGRVKLTLDEDPEDAWYRVMGFHHIGTTRMSDNPKTGVVDTNCRVHGVSNLYIASSSVFPTSGFANPTLTIVTLAIRLADHIKGALQ